MNDLSTAQRPQRQDGYCTLSEMLPLFQELYAPAPSEILGLVARAKRLLAMGVASEPPGRGRTAFYGCGEVRRLLVAMELGHVGISPEKAVALLNEHDAKFFGATGVVTITVGPRQSAVSVDMGALREAIRTHLPQMFYFPASRTKRSRQDLHAFGCLIWVDEGCTCK